MKVLIVSATEKGRSYLSDLLKTHSVFQTQYAANGSEARRIFIEQPDFQLILINAPLRDEFGDDLAVFATETTSAGLLLLVNADLSDEIAEKVGHNGILVLSKPLSRQLFYQSIQISAAIHHRIYGLKNENLRLQKTLSELRIVNRAKCVLIQYLNMSEQQAHRYIEKQAMDLRQNKAEIAQNILKTYEN